MGREDDAQFTSHKTRAEWFQDRTSFPRREIYPPALAECAARATLEPRWKELGPHDIGGRLTSLAVHPRDPDTIYAGAAGGGVWYSSNAGQSWRSIWGDQAASLAIGSLALDPPKPNVLYVGTGEANNTADNYPGVGVFRTTDNGANWERIGSPEDTFADIPGGQIVVSGLPRRIGALAVDPFDADHMLLGGATHSESEVAGLFESTDGGRSWDRAGDRDGTIQFHDRPVFVSAFNFFCSAVLFHPAIKGLIFVTVEARGTQSGIWVSRDGARSWEHCRNGLPSGDQFGRTSLALSGNTVYALAAEAGNFAFLGIFRSDDLGASWQQFDCPMLRRDGQLHYTNCIAVDPANPRVAVAGSVNLYMTENGGLSWRTIADRLDPERFAHGDHHALAFVGDRIYSATDGGLAVSLDRGEHWEMRNKGLAISMFYDVDVAPTDSTCMGGGIQDHGTWCSGPLNRAERGLLGTDQAQERLAFRPQLGGDGGWILYDPDDETHIIASRERINLFRHREGEGWKPLSVNVPEAERNRVWMAILAMDTSAGAKRPRALYAGSTRVYKSIDDGDTWDPTSKQPLDGSVITAMEVAPADPRCIYVGTTKGGFFRSFDAGGTWSKNLAGPNTPGRTVTRIETAPDNPHHVFYAVGLVAEELEIGGPELTLGSKLARGGFPVFVNGKSFLREFFHLYCSTDGGDNWGDLDGGGLPNLPHQAVVLTGGLQDGWVLVGSDGGVMARRLAEGPVEGRWWNVTGNLPNVRITDLVYHERDRLLVAATYGRGLWRIPLASIERFVDAAMAGETRRGRSARRGQAPVRRASRGRGGSG